MKDLCPSCGDEFDSSYGDVECEGCREEDIEDDLNEGGDKLHFHPKDIESVDVTWFEDYKRITLSLNNGEEYSVEQDD